MKKTKLMLGDNIESLRKLPDNSIDSIVTDPPYALTSIKKRFGKEGAAPAQFGTDGAFQRASKGFMGKEWDAEVPTVEFWREVYRVLKPGGHILSFGGTRTYHRMAVNIEDAGFEIRDQIMWLYGSGFPKSHNIGLNIDKKNGETGNRGKAFVVAGQSGQKDKDTGGDLVNGGAVVGSYQANNKWNGWGTALKPANEPICVARKPLSEKSVAENVLKWGTGGMNIDGCRVGSETISIHNAPKGTFAGGEPDRGSDTNSYRDSEGRFPANVMFECICDEVLDGGIIKSGSSNRDDKGVVSEGVTKFTRGQSREITDKVAIHTNPNCPCYVLDNQSGISKSTPSIRPAGEYEKNSGFGKYKESISTFSDKGGASRFFYVAKVSKKERNLGLDSFEDKEGRSNISGLDDKPRLDGTIRETPIHKNNHPTLKPINLMTYLCRLVTPQGGIVLDPFMGSGSTGIAALLEGFRFVGMEMDKDYFKIAEARIESYEQYRDLLK